MRGGANKATVLGILFVALHEQQQHRPGYAAFMAVDPLTIRDAALRLPDEQTFQHYVYLEAIHRVLHELRQLQLRALGYHEQPTLFETVEELHARQQREEQRQALLQVVPDRARPVVADLAALQRNEVPTADGRWDGSRGRANDLMALVLVWQEGGYLVASKWIRLMRAFMQHFGVAIPESYARRRDKANPGVVQQFTHPFVAGADGLKVLKPKAVDARWYYYALLGIALPDRGYGRHFQYLKNALLPIPPLPEQRRIVAKLEELFSHLDAGVATLRQTQAQLKRYRQSVLHAAVTGELTRAWRATHPEPAESGAALLQRIRAERRARWEAALLAKRVGQLPLGDAWKKKYEEPAAPDTSELPELPQGWVWASLDDFLTQLRNGISTNPTGESGLRILRISAVRALQVRQNEVRFLPGRDEDYSDYLAGVRNGRSTGAIRIAGCRPAPTAAGRRRPGSR